MKDEQNLARWRGRRGRSAVLQRTQQAKAQRPDYVALPKNRKQARIGAD